MITYFICYSFLQVFFKIFFRFKARFTENYPKKGPFLIASNHLSFLDPAIVGISIRRQICFLARESLFHNPVFNWWGTTVGAIPIKRGRFDISAIKGSLERLRRGYIVALFPEGTRSKDGTIKDPKAGVGFLAAKAGVPVVPVFIKGSDKALPHNSAFIRLKPIEIRVGRPVEPRMFLKSDGACDYEALSKEVMGRIEGLGRS